MSVNYQQKNELEFLRLRLRKLAAKTEEREAKKSHSRRVPKFISSGFVRSKPRAVETLTKISGAEAAAFAAEISASPFAKQAAILADEAHCDELDARLILARADYMYYGKQYFPNAFTEEYSETFHPDFFNLLHDVETHGVRKPTVVYAPRDTGKSTSATLLVPTHAVAFKSIIERPDGKLVDLSKRYGVFLGAIQRLASKPLRRIAFEFENNEQWIADFGDRYRDSSGRPPTGRAWSKTDIVLSTGQQFEAVGRHGHLRGMTANDSTARVDLMIGDDLEDDKRARSAKLREEDVEHIQKVVLNMIAQRNGNALILGTFLHMSSALSQLMDFGKLHGWPMRVYPIYKDTAAGRVYLWPQRYGPDFVEKKLEEIPESVFNQEYLGIASAGQRELSWGEIQYYEMQDIQSMLDANQLRITGGIDPACKPGEKNDYTAAVPLALDRGTGTFYVLPAVLAKLNHRGKVNTILDMHRLWNPLLIGVESVQYQITLKEAVDEEAAKLGYGINTFPIQQFAEKFLRLSRLYGPVRSGRMKFLRGDKTHRLILDQLMNLGEGHDDGPDGLEIALQCQDKLARSKKNANRARAHVSGSTIGRRET